MFYLLSKIIGFFINPIVWIFGLLLVSFFIKNKKSRHYVLISATALLFIFSNAFVLNEILIHWENRHQAPVMDTNRYDYGIVLGGMVDYDKTDGSMNFLQSSDRIWQTVKLYKEQKINKILISGGAADVFGQDTIESVILKRFLVTIGIPEQDILTEEYSRNTHENATFTKQLLKDEPKARLLLVTSAMHMHRAQGCFKKAGLTCEVYPTDFYSGSRHYTISDILIPNPRTLFNWNAFIHELFGIISYKIAGYI